MQQEEQPFQSIRPFNDEEVKDVIDQLLKEPNFLKVLSVVYPNLNINDITGHIKRITTIKAFQKEVVYYYLTLIIKKTVDKLSFTGLEKLDPSKHYLFMSNHRDIILDSALLNVILFENEMRTTEIAIGSNLLIFPWIEMLVKLNKSFVVRRNLPVKEMLMASHELSSYIQHTLIEKKHSVWIAQKEGRTKDGDDNTHPGLLKMIHMSSDQPVAEYFKSLNLIPVSISYEIEPCDLSKTAELYARMRDGSYVKDPKEDLLSMSGGLTNYKGRVHFTFGNVLKEELDVLNDIHNKNEQYSKLGQIIDNSIHQGFQLFEGSFIAYDILSKSDKFKDRYAEDEYQAFTKRMTAQIQGIEGDKEIIKRIYLGIYANPLINKFKLEKISTEQNA